MADRVEMRLDGLDGVLDMLRKMPAEVVSKRGGPVRASLRKGAVVIQKQEIANLRAVTTGGDSSGLLAQNVVVTRGKPPSEGNGERYLVRVRRKIYPRKGGTPVSTLKTAQLLEYGSSRQPAKPWIRPAFAAKAADAIRTVESSLVAAVDRIASRLLKAGR